MLDDAFWLRRAFRLAEQSVEHGDYPYAALLVDPDGRGLLSSEQYLQRSGNWLGHAELLLLEEASRRWTRAHIAGATMYSSTEPCPMCSGAIGWSLNRLVYGLSQAEMYHRFVIAGSPPRFIQPWNCRILLDNVEPPIEVIGPMLEDDAAVAHAMWMERWVPTPRS